MGQSTFPHKNRTPIILLPVRCMMAAGLLALLGPSLTADEFAAGPSPVDLRAKARTAAEPVAKLFRELATPADEITLENGTILRVVPVPQFLGPSPNFAGTIDVLVLGEKSVRKLKSSEIAGVVSFEQKALARINQFFAGDGVALDAVEKGRAAETALESVLWFHFGTRDRPLRGPSPWSETGSQLSAKLREVRRGLLAAYLQAAAAGGASKDALAAAERFARAHPNDNAIGRLTRELWAQHGLQLFKKGRLAEARACLDRIENRYLHAPEADPLRKVLQARAEALAREAAMLEDKEAAEKYAEALALWPRLPSVRDEWLKLQNKYRILYVGVRNLPEYLSPATAWTDADKQAVDLLFESLVQPIYSRSLGSAFEARLASALPEIAPLKREFSLRRDARWSDGERVNSADVRHTFNMLMASDLPGRMVPGAVAAPRVDRPAFAITFTLRQGVRDPLALLSFKVLPQRFRGKPLMRADDPEFARAPIGSGPYIFLGRRDDGRVYAVFGANPEFVREGRPNQPYIREIRFFAWQDAARDLNSPQNRGALLLDVPTEQLETLRKMQIPGVQTHLPRRTYFLAINHRRPALTNLDLRRALAFTLDRDRLLAAHFRGGHPEMAGVEAAGAALALPLLTRRQGHKEFHRALTGPYPVDSWACCHAPRVPADLYDVGKARALFRQAAKALGKIQLTLKFPADDPRLAGACADMCEQIQQVAASAGVQLGIQPMALEPRDFKKALEQRDYDLAYHYWDFEDETYWLWPLFDTHPSAMQAGGSNILGYDNDSRLEELFRQAHEHRQFAKVREFTHHIHAHLVQKMPLIPLWQLHRHIVVPPILHASELDPLHVFLHAETWKMER
jgi:peptide/nickel transport system substrate-binding protein